MCYYCTNTVIMDCRKITVYEDQDHGHLLCNKMIEMSLIRNIYIYSV